MKNFKMVAASILVTSVLAACGGGGGESANDAPVSVTAASGLWEGTAGGRSIAGLVLNTGEYYFLYSVDQKPTTIAGMFNGTLATRAGTSTSTDGKDFSLELRKVLPANLSASLREKKSFAGNVVYPDGTVTAFTTQYNPAYEIQATLPAITGNYAANIAVAAGYDQAVVAINAAGTFATKTAKGCSLTGKVVPRANENVYNLTVQFGAAPCAFANQTINGITYLDSRTNTLYGLGMTADKTTGFSLVGLKK